jgi:uncharacterized protein YbjT (DUF2867 family)
MTHPTDSTDPGPSADGDLAVGPGSLVLVAGASGYIGGRLVGELLDAGYRVRCLVRSPAKLAAAPWADRVEIVQGDVTAPLDGGAGGAFGGVDAAYYLIHSIGADADWVERDRAAAAGFRDAAAVAGVRRIVYLGGLGDAGDGTGPSDLSPHLASRHEVGEVLAAGEVPVTELRAAVIIGSGSASFEMLRYLVEVLPVMVTPKWVETRCQPIAVRDVLRYLVDVLGEPRTAGRVLEIGGTDVLSYRQMMAIYAEEAGLRRRRLIPVPVLSPSLSSWWVGLVTPLPRALARPLVNSLVNEVVVHDHAIEDLCPGPLHSYREAVRLALGRIRNHEVATSWAGADISDKVADPMPTDPNWSGGTVLADRRQQDVHAGADDAYAVVTAIGGQHGWYGGEWLWSLRGLLDKVVGGPGMRRGRRHPTELRVGETVDFWRVEALERPGLVRLRAEMRLPGEAWLEWRIEPVVSDPERCVVHQLARFHPRGLWGRMYWLGVAPFHRFVFPNLLGGIAGDAEGRAAARAALAV